MENQVASVLTFVALASFLAGYHVCKYKFKTLLRRGTFDSVADTSTVDAK